MQYIKTKVKYVKLPHYIDNDKNLSYGSEAAACFDICAAINQQITIKAGERFFVPTGLKTSPEFPIWFRVNSRSGLAYKHGIITIAGIIDTDYRGEWFIGLLNTSNQDYIISSGDKIAQVELPSPYRAQFVEVSQEDCAIENTQRGESGFGSSGK